MITSKSLWQGGLGRFGNTCFTLASMIGIACKNGQPWGVKGWITKDNELFGQKADDIEQYLINPLPKLPDGLNFNDISYHWEYRDYNIPAGNWNITSHLQDERYFSDYMPLIRHHFRFKDEPEQNDYVAIHYRAGDYIDDPDAYHPRCSMEYYVNAMSIFPDDTKFYLFSDDLSAIDNLRYNKDYFVRVEPITGTYIEDFKLMKRCKHFITANSSFSMFAAILGEHPDKKIIAPRRWFGTQANGLTFDYPKNCIVI